MRLSTEDKKDILDGVGALIRRHKLQVNSLESCTQPDDSVDDDILIARSHIDRLTVLELKLEEAWTEEVVVEVRRERRVR